MHKASHRPDVALFNIMAFHTCGRCGNVGNTHQSHFVLTGDCIGLQFPVTKTAQTGTAKDITSPSTPAVVGETFFQHPGKSFAYAVPSTFSMPSVNVMVAWRMWHGGSKRCGQTRREKVRPFKDIPEEHLLAISKTVTRNWRMWKRVMDHLCKRLDELKRKGVYDWKGSDGNKSPLAPQTLMYLTEVIPAAPQKPSKFKRTIVASNNKVGIVYKNMSRAKNQ